MGVAGYKYMLDEGFVANSTYNVTNACYNPELDLAVDLPVNIQKIFFLADFCPSMSFRRLTARAQRTVETPHRSSTLSRATRRRCTFPMVCST